MQSLCTPRSAREEAPVATKLSAHEEAMVLKKNLATACSQKKYRPPKQGYTSMGEYRPYMRPADEVKKEEEAAKIGQEKGEEFQKMLELLGEKVRQKFSKARDVFRFVDTDHNLKLSRGEVRYFFRFFNVVAEQADKFFDGFEADEDGEICYVEFLKYLWPHVNPGNETTPWRLTKGVKDEDRAMISLTGRPKLKLSPSQHSLCPDQVLSVAELPNDLRIARINIAQRLIFKFKSPREAFRTLDVNKDGTVELEEMKFFFRNLGWEHVAERFYDLLSNHGTTEVKFVHFTALFDVTKDLDSLRLRL
jgi:Ca2+-binding EF-hand superfamily protein